MGKKMRKTVPLLGLAVLVLAGCATRIAINAQRPPNLDTLGLHRIAVAPFTANVAAASPLTQELTSQAISRIQATGAFTLVTYDTVRAVQARGADLESYVDAVFRGRITNFAINTSSHPWEFRDRHGNVTRGTTHVREVEVAFEYYFVRVRDGSMVGPVRRAGQTSASSENIGDLPSGSALASRVIQQQAASIHRDVAPHTIRVTRTMERERNRDLRPLMNAAESRRRGGDYLGAREAYVAIWNNHRSIAAAINAAILFEATGDLEDGIFFMEQVFEATRSPQASQKLAQLNREAAYLLGLRAFDYSMTPAERVASHAASEVQRAVSAPARLWIHNNTTFAEALVNDVIDNMTAALLNSGFTIVERGMIDLVLAEQNLHLGGAVADSDFVSIGNLAGANTVVVINMIGTGGARRLQARVLDIETATLRMQSDTGVAWRL